MSRMKATAVALAVLFAASCGGGSDDAEDAGVSSASTSSTVADGTAAANDPGGTTGAGGAAGQAPGSAAPAPGGSASTPTTAPADQATGGSSAQSTQPATPLEVTLEHRCVKAGGTQTITIKSSPGAAAGYDSYYPDGRSGISDGFYGGNSGNNIPPDGTWRDTWTIAPNAPTGQVRVHVQAIKVEHRVATQDLFFELVGPTGSCP